MITFYVIECKKWKIYGFHNMFDAFGKNSLLAYCAAEAVDYNFRGSLPADSPAWIVLIFLFIAISTMFLGMSHLRKVKTFVVL